MVKFEGNKKFRERMKNKYKFDKRYNAPSEDLKEMHSLLNNFGFYFEYRKFHEAIKLFKFSKINFENKKILDIGCHRGFQLNNMAFLKGTSKELYGIDFMPQFIKQAKVINPRINYRVMDVYCLKFKNDFFDFASLIYFLNCIPQDDRTTIAKNISNKIKVGGHILVFEFSDNFIINSIRKTIKVVKGGGAKPLEYANDKILKKYFKDFEVVKSKNIINFLSKPLSGVVSYPFIELLDYVIPNGYYIALLKKVK